MSRGTPSETPQEIAQIRKSLRHYQILAGLLLLTTLGLTGWHLTHRPPLKSSGSSEPTTSPIDPRAPHAAEVQKIVDPLRYSFMPILSKPNVRIDLDFNRGVWTLRNIHEFDAQGSVVLAEGRYGLCGELAAYTYQKVRPIFEKDYHVRFVRAAESSYFPAPLNTHFVISLVNKNDATKVFIIDPSFRRYGPLEEFDDYLFFEHLHALRFVAQKDPNNMEIINRAMPVMITHGVKLSIMAQVEGGRFDRNNFSLCILGTSRNTYMPNRVYKIGLMEGKRFENERAIDDVDLSNVPEYTALKRRLQEFFEQIVKTRPTYSAG